MEEWNNIPEIEDRSLKRKRAKEREIFTPVPDSVIEAQRMRDSMETYLDPRQQSGAGFETPSDMQLSAAREKVVSFLVFELVTDTQTGPHV